MIELPEEEDARRSKKKKLRKSCKGKGQAALAGSAAVEVKTGAA